MNELLVGLAILILLLAVMPRLVTTYLAGHAESLPKWLRVEREPRSDAPPRRDGQSDWFWLVIVVVVLVIGFVLYLVVTPCSLIHPFGPGCD